MLKYGVPTGLVLVGVWKFKYGDRRPHKVHHFNFIGELNE